MFAGKNLSPSARPSSPGLEGKRRGAANCRCPSVDSGISGCTTNDTDPVVDADALFTLAQAQQIAVFGEAPAIQANVFEDHSLLPTRHENCDQKNGKTAKEQKIDYFAEFGRRFTDGDHEWRELVAESWMKVPKKSDPKSKQLEEQLEESGSGEGGTERTQPSGGQKKVSEADNKKKKGEFARRLWGDGLGSSKVQGAGKRDGREEESASSDGATDGADLVPKTFEDMGLFNARMIGANLTWIDMLFKNFDVIVRCTVNGDDARLEQETSIFALRMNKDTAGKIDLKEFGVCMGSSMQALRGKMWTSQYSNAWRHLWEIVTDRLQSKLTLPRQYEKVVHGLVVRMDQNEKNSFGLAVFKRLFEKVPPSENYFKQSNTRLCFIVSRALEMCMEIYQEPTRLVCDIISLGIRHIMWNIPTTYFEPFVQCMLDECVARYSEASLAIKGLEWSMRIIAGIMVQTIGDGSSPLIEAVVLNRPKATKKALEDTARKDRVVDCL